MSKPMLLEDLLELARTVEITPEMKRQTIISFAYGNTKMENENITKEMVEKAYDELWGKDESL